MPAAVTSPTSTITADPSSVVEEVHPRQLRLNDAGQEPLNTIPVPAPFVLRLAYSPTEDGVRAVHQGRRDIRRILRGEDSRLLVVVGPCSLHDPEAALEYARLLADLNRRVSDRLCVVMRAYFEKPRTTVGWRGLINDPHMDGSFDMAEGLRRARRLLVSLTDLGLPVATEVLDISTPLYFDDLISFAAVGARTTESQPHRALASGLPLPVGFKNGTGGNVQVAVDAMLSARESHSYLGFDGHGRGCMVRTAGNPDTTLILRGGKSSGPNFDETSVQNAIRLVEKAGLKPTLMVDCSHANSGYDHNKQVEVCEEVTRQRRDAAAQGKHCPSVAVMLESNILPGKQNLPNTLTGAEKDALTYGVSVTDACLGWEDTERLLLSLA